jgi:hypothetical protein
MPSDSSHTIINLILILSNNPFIASKFVVQLNNSDNKYYSSKFMFGSDKQNISLVADTQTDWTIVLAAECTSCSLSASRYDRTTSTTH